MLEVRGAVRAGAMHPDWPPALLAGERKAPAPVRTVPNLDGLLGAEAAVLVDAEPGSRHGFLSHSPNGPPTDPANEAADTTRIVR